MYDAWNCWLALVGVKREKNDMLAWECMMHEIVECMVHEIVDWALVGVQRKKIDWEIMNGRKM
jgi:hypothetical protein